MLNANHQPEIIRRLREKNANPRQQLFSWYDDVARAEWNTPVDLASHYGWDAVLGETPAVFKIKGNDYRLVARINYTARAVEIRFIGTHAEYDKIDALNI